VLTLVSSPLYYVSPAYLARIAPVVYGGDLRRGSAASPHVARWLAPAPRAAGYAYQLYAISGWTSLPWLHRLASPTLILAGDDDPLVPVGNARLLAQRIPRTELIIAPGGGHFWLLERPHDSATVLDQFLDR
jgi:pimeloyl-ACP methyl ester carboxylesterase